MKIGTKSLLFGAHQFLIHPLFVFIGWCKLYGFPWDPRLHIAFIIHDWGYWNKPNMDGKEGETHPEFAAKLMHKLFDRPYIKRKDPLHWFHFCLYHSRYYAKKDNKQPSKLCFADKCASNLEPKWLYLFKVKLTGEYKEFIEAAKQRIAAGQLQECGKFDINTLEGWYDSMCAYMNKYVKEFAHGKKDNWTPKIE